MNEHEEWELTYNYLLGISSGLEAYSRELRQAAGDLYAQGKDTKAHIYRELADEIKARSIRERKAAKEHKERYEENNGHE